MQRSIARALALGGVLVVLLAACSGGVSDAEGDACNAVLAWTSADQGTERFAETVEKVRASLRDVDDSPLTDALATLESSASGQEAADAEAFLAVCSGEGWELPEG